MSRRYCFIEFKHKKSLKKIHKGKSKKRLGSKYYYIDFEKGRRSHHWLPQRLGGGKGEFERDYPKRIYKDIKILKKIYPELADDDDDLYSSISSSESNSEYDKNDDKKDDDNVEKKNIDVDEYLRIEREKSGSRKKYLIYNKEMQYEKDFEKIFGIRSDSKSIYRFNGYMSENIEKLKDIKNDILNIEENNNENNNENNEENNKNDKSRSSSFLIENLKEKKSRSISKNSYIRQRDRSRSINLSISNRDLLISNSRNLSESEELIFKKRHKKRRKHKKHRRHKSRRKRESDNEEIDERNQSFSTIRNKSRSISKKLSKSKSNNSINNINIVKSEIESDSDATIILTAENRHKYELGKL